MASEITTFVPNGPGYSPLARIFARIGVRPSPGGSIFVRGGVQGAPDELGEVEGAEEFGTLRRKVFRPGAGASHHSCSKAARRAVMPRNVWLLTAPRLMPMLAAISASDRSA